ncbi:MAG TPA: transglycosylase SLT domain-containing protein [Candidatus Angelobacter sp.]|nr:transglycosylase SLT domain-containing protein [Candidatus Angelobacter sp.]
MKFPLNRKLLAGLSTGLLLFVACQSKDHKKVITPPPQAVAPSMPTPVVVAIAPTPKPEPTPPPPDPVIKTIDEAEKAYQSGLVDYKAGHLDAAKQDFNHAVDVLMQGPVDINHDDRLQNQFDKITEEIHKLEMAAFKEGDGFTAQQSEPAPIDEANQLTFPADPNMTAKVEASLRNTQSDLPLVINDYVAGYINYFASRGRGVFERAAVRSGRYRDMILRIFKEEGIPQDLIYLAQAESGFHPSALSRAGARGMWQFMASRASGYGLDRNWWVDDRQDPEKATRAAARHLKDLYQEFGDWYLAMAAYNSGPGNVQQAVKRTGYADFWELYRRDVLPKETKNYVPIILAMTILSKNPAQYGLDDLKVDAPDQYDVVKVDYPVDLRLVAECVDFPVERLVELNPSLLRRTTPKDRSYDLRLPEGSKDKYETSIAAIPRDKRVQWRFHKAEPGDTLASIAKKYHTTEKAIAAANSLQGTDLPSDAKLVIPASGPIQVEGQALSYAKSATRYKVRKGDTVLSVADDFGVPAERLRRWNRLKGNRLVAGHVLLIYKPLSPGEPQLVKAHHRRKNHHAVAKASAKTAAQGQGQKEESPSSPSKDSTASVQPSKGVLAASGH